MSWARWALMLREAPCAETLDLIAAEMHAAQPVGEPLAGVVVKRVDLGGTLGTVVDRGSVRYVLVERSLEPIAALFVAAHELGHLLMAEARWVLRDRLSLDAEERLCDRFAERVTGQNLKEAMRGASVSAPACSVSRTSRGHDIPGHPAATTMRTYR